jgi:hypothetical protein
VILISSSPSLPFIPSTPLVDSAKSLWALPIVLEQRRIGPLNTFRDPLKKSHTLVNFRANKVFPFTTPSITRTQPNRSGWLLIITDYFHQIPHNLLKPRKNAHSFRNWIFLHHKKVKKFPFDILPSANVPVKVLCPTILLGKRHSLPPP